MHSQKASPAFTRVELCVVLAVMSLLATLVLPALAREQNRDWRIVCLRRMSQFATALALYATDNRDYLPPNYDDGNTAPGFNWCPGQAGVGGVEEFNADILKDPKRSMLAQYLGNDASIFKCPTDTRHGKYPGIGADVDPARKGQDVPAARTVSLNNAVGTNPFLPGCKTPVTGPWLDGNHTYSNNKTWYCYGQTSDFVRPGPAATFTIAEEDPRSLNDGVFCCMGPNDQSLYKMIDWPMTSHGMAGAFAFADGHAEMHRWVDPRTPLFNLYPTTSQQPQSHDLDWIARHASARINP